MIRWEYDRIKVEFADVRDLQRWGEAGWEAVGFSPHGWLLLKRPLGESVPVNVGRRGPLTVTQARRSVTRVDL